MRPPLLHALWLPAVTLPCPGLHCCRSYLIALAVGHLESRKVGPRTHVWAEPEVVDAAAYEFGETENYIATAEAIAGEYVDSYAQGLRYHDDCVCGQTHDD